MSKKTKIDSDTLTYITIYVAAEQVQEQFENMYYTDWMPKLLKKKYEALIKAAKELAQEAEWYSHIEITEEKEKK